MIAYRVRVRDAEQGIRKARRMRLRRRYWSARWRIAGAAAAGSSLIRQADCFNCHHVQEKLVGPPFLAIADKYRGQAGAADASVERVIKGSTGVWGPIPMLPHGHHTRDPIRAMVEYIYGLDANAAKPAIARGLAGEIPAPPSDGSRAVLIDAVFTDAGAAPASPLVGKASLALRARRIEAEQADAVAGSQALGGSQASGGRFIGGIADGHHLLFKAINLGAAGGLKWRVASAGQGAAVELRLGAPDGPLLSAISVEPTGGWENWVEMESALGATKPNEAADVYVVFKNPGKSGLMNLDWIEFLP
ncbi:MAG: carbohydrate-binding protein [Verrucomicrobiales bacterium]